MTPNPIDQPALFSIFLFNSLLTKLIFSILLILTPGYEVATSKYLTPSFSLIEASRLILLKETISIGDDSIFEDRFLRVLSGDANTAGIEAHGNSQGTGYLFVGESATSGGGIFYNGDLATGSFASGKIQDTVGFYRKFAGSNTLVFSYPTTSNDVTFRGTVDAQNFNSSSDERLKTNIEKVVEANEILNQIDGVKFTWKSDNTSSYGVIAQQVEKVLPELVKEDEHKKVNYDGLIAVLIESVKNQQERINVLEEKIKSLESE